VKVSIKLIFGLVIGLAGLFLSIKVGGVMWGIFFQDGLELTERSMDQLDLLIKDLSNLEKTNTLFYLDKGYKLVSFDSGFSKKSDAILKPTGCSNNACLAVCSTSGGQESCLSPPFYSVFENILEFDSEHISGVILTKTKEYMTLELEKKDSVVIIREIKSNQ
jgi:hypothetical protein